MESVIEKAAVEMATLDAAGYAIVVLRCPSEADIRAVVARYAHRTQRKKAKIAFRGAAAEYAPGKDPHILEVTALETVKCFGEPFSWLDHGTDGNPDESVYAADHHLMTHLSAACMLPGSREHTLLYIPDLPSLVGNGELQERSPAQKQYLRLMKEIARLKRQGDSNLLMVVGCTNGMLCRELSRESYIMDIPCPEQEELLQLIEAACRDCDAGEFRMSRSQANALAEIMRGFREEDVRRIFDLAFAAAENPLAGGCQAIFEAARSAKKQMVTGVKGLHWVESRGSRLGGLHNLRGFLNRSKTVFDYPHLAQLQKAQPPRGVLLVGLPGSGKTTAADYTAALLGGGTPLPLIKMNMSDFMDKYLSVSEANCAVALDMVESVAPCVLHIDEFDKFMDGIHNGTAHEVTMHIYSAFLEWMEKQREKPVFVIATANESRKLKPEAKRRFSEIFFLGVPCRADCEEILRIHLEKKESLILREPGYRENMERLVDTLLSEAARKHRFLNGKNIECIVDTAFQELFVASIETMTPQELSGREEEARRIEYTVEQVRNALLGALDNTRSFFDNNMEVTVAYWLEMFEQKYLEAGGAPREPDGRNWTVLPADSDAFSLKTGRFSARWLKEKNMLSTPVRVDVDGRPLEEYLRWLEEQLTAATEAADYDAAFRWCLALAIGEKYR